MPRPQPACPPLLEEHKPQLVLVTLGGNDMLRAPAAGADNVANLGRMVDLGKASGARSFWFATPRPSVAGAFFNNLSAADFYRDVAQGQGGFRWGCTA